MSGVMGLCVGVSGSFFAGWRLVVLCLWFTYPVSGVGVDCANAEAMNRCMR
jgi:hypothetical protein